MQIIENYPLEKKNTFGLKCTAKFYLNVDSIEILEEFSKMNVTKFLILGGGSNLVLPEYYDGYILDINIKGYKVSEDDDYITVAIGAGEIWHDTIQRLINDDIYGFENLALIPGKVGAAPVQNIGAYGIEQEKYFNYLEVFDISTGKMKVLNKQECKFGYRDSIFKQNCNKNQIITKVIYKFPKNWNLTLNYKDIQDYLISNNISDVTPKLIFNAICNIRSNKLPDPMVLGNAGSFFKNPVVSKEFYDVFISKFPNLRGFLENNNYKLSAAKLIETAGWKGKKLNESSSIMVSDKHSLVIINLGNGLQKDIIKLSDNIIEDIFNKFSIRLEREVNIVK
jgi:UDP-N-acetylmuramate dehydrogenase